MPRRDTASWEQAFASWARPPSDSEEARCENAVRAVRGAVANSALLAKRNIKVFVQGSYRNNVNVRLESDVDIGVMCYDYFLVRYPEGKSDADFGNHDAGYSYRQFKDELEHALVSHFGRAAVTRGNKAFDVHANSYRVDADVAPFFEFRHYYDSGSYLCGVALVPDAGTRVVNYPEILLDTWPNIDQHYENGVSKNTRTGRAYKSAVRIFKRLRNELADEGVAEAGPIPGFLLECMLWNVPDHYFSAENWDRLVQQVFGCLWVNTRESDKCAEWVEVNDIKYLFRSTQPWTREQAFAFVDKAWDYVGVRAT